MLLLNCGIPWTSWATAAAATDTAGEYDDENDENDDDERSISFRLELESVFFRLLLNLSELIVVFAN